MGDLLKEAIADAKAVRETALQNAKMALEEAFTPQLKSMLAAKLREDDLEGEEEFGDEEMGDEFGEEEPEVPAEEGYYEDEEGGEEFGDEEMGDEEIPGEEDELDLEAIIRELEAELSEENADMYEGEEKSEKPVEESSEESEDTVKEEEETEVDESVLDEDEELDEEKEEVDEISQSSGIGGGDNSLNAASGKDQEDPGAKDQFKTAKLESVQSELNEYKQAVGFLKDKLHEVNILNAKLLFTNKLFKEFALDNSDKLRIVETFDRAQTVREIKIVYATLAESFKHNTNIKSIKEAVGRGSDFGLS